MAKIINLFDNNNHHEEINKDASDTEIKMNVEFDKVSILQYIKNNGYTLADIKSYNMIKLNNVIKDALVSTHGWLGDFATNEDILSIIAFVKKNFNNNTVLKNNY